MEKKTEMENCLAELEPDAIRALTFLAQRLLAGQKAYGRLDLAKDPRDWRKERAEELGDLLVYTAFLQLKRDLETAHMGPPQKACLPPPAPPLVIPAPRMPPGPTGLRFVCDCMPRELRLDKGVRCATCDRFLTEDGRPARPAR
jgi:hypothetical protein